MKSIKFDDCNKLWFTSDTHFDHAAIIDYCERPFTDEADMNRNIASNWNEVVKPDDIIFILGDFSFGKRDTWCWRLDHLNGHKYLIKGNHDHEGNIPIDKFAGYTEGFMDILVKDPEIKDGQRVTLCHYPMLSWFQSHRGAWQLFGHVHGKLYNDNLAQDGFDLRGKLMPTQLDVGVDPWKFYPVSWYQVTKVITKQCLKYKGG